MLTRVLALLLFAPASVALGQEIGPCRGLAIPVCRALDGDGVLPFMGGSSGRCSSVSSPLAKAACYGMADSKSNCERYAKEVDPLAISMCDDMVQIGDSLRDGKFARQSSCSVRNPIVEKFCVALGTPNYSTCPKDEVAEGCVDIAKLLMQAKKDMETYAKAGAGVAAKIEAFEEREKKPAPVPQITVTADLRSYYKLTGAQTLTVLVNGANGATKDLDVTFDDGAAENSRIVWQADKILTTDAMADWGFGHEQWPLTFTAKYGTHQVGCGAIRGDWKEITVQVTWQGMTVATTTGSPILCKVTNR